MHQSIPEVGAWRGQMVREYFNAVPTNYEALTAFRHHVTHLWHRALHRRGNRDNTTWPPITSIADTTAHSSSPT
jgi:RNA-directed DNA polymerase